MHYTILTIGDRMIYTKRVAKIARRVRKLSYSEKIELMDWLNAWYSNTKEDYQ